MPLDLHLSAVNFDGFAKALDRLEKSGLRVESLNVHGYRLSITYKGDGRNGTLPYVTNIAKIGS